MDEEDRRGTGNADHQLGLVITELLPSRMSRPVRCKVPELFDGLVERNRRPMAGDMADDVGLLETGKTPSDRWR